jgi:hypothetical protein
MDAIFRQGGFDVDINIYDSIEDGKKSTENKFFIFKMSGPISRHSAKIEEYYAITEKSEIAEKYIELKEFISMSPEIALVGSFTEDEFVFVRFMDRKKRNSLLRGR